MWIFNCWGMMRDVWINSSSVIHVYAQHKKTQQTIRPQFTFDRKLQNRRLRLIYAWSLFLNRGRIIKQCSCCFENQANFFVLIQGIDALYASQQGEVKNLWWCWRLFKTRWKKHQICPSAVKSNLLLSGVEVKFTHRHRNMHIEKVWSIKLGWCSANICSEPFFMACTLRADRQLHLCNTHMLVALGGTCTDIQPGLSLSPALPLFLYVSLFCNYWWSSTCFVFLCLQHWRSCEAGDRSNYQQTPFHGVNVWQHTVCAGGKRKQSYSSLVFTAVRLIWTCAQKIIIE